MYRELGVSSLVLLWSSPEIRYYLCVYLNGIEISEAAIEAFCRANGIVRLSLFGSILRSDFTPTSDVDVLVELDPQRAIGLFQFAGLQIELSKLLGRQAHLHTPGMLPPRVRESIRSSAKVQYAA